jgi:hypothetical protein
MRGFAPVDAHGPGLTTPLHRKLVPELLMTGGSSLLARVLRFPPLTRTMFPIMFLGGHVPSRSRFAGRDSTPKAPFQRLGVEVDATGRSHDALLSSRWRPSRRPALEVLALQAHVYLPGVIGRAELVDGGQHAVR